MDLFSISDLQQFSGIKTHTIRVWEQRYNALTPARSIGNTRYYDNFQLRRLLNIVSLKESKYKVSELCTMTDEMLFSMVEEKQTDILQSDKSNEYFISQLIAAATSFDEVHFEKIFSKCLFRYDMKHAYINVIYPLLKRIGVMWSIGSILPAHEHFICNIIKQKLYAAIDSIPPPKNNSNSWLLFLPENEFHEIGLLLSHYLIKQADIKVIYLGSNVPYDTLVDAIEKTNPIHILFFLVHNDTPKNPKNLLDSLKMKFEKINIHLSGNENLISNLKRENKFNWINSIEELEKQLCEI